MNGSPEIIARAVNVTRQYTLGKEIRHGVARACPARHLSRRISVDHGPVGFRQIDVLQL